MPDSLEQWLEGVEQRHRQDGQGECRYCYGRDWPCDAVLAARVIRAQGDEIESLPIDRWTWDREGTGWAIFRQDSGEMLATLDDDEEAKAICDALNERESEIARLRTALEEIATMPNKPGYHNTWLGRWLAARDAAENALAAIIEGQDSE